MVQLQESGRYDDAVRVVQDWMSQHRNDTSKDDFLHLQIAMVYTIKAYQRQSTRDESLRNSASHLEQALNLYAAKKPEDVDDSMLFGIGSAYETIGDISQKNKCQYFAKARKAFQDELPLIKGDSHTLRADVRKHLASIEEKSTQAGCGVP